MEKKRKIAAIYILFLALYFFVLIIGNIIKEEVEPAIGEGYYVYNTKLPFPIKRDYIPSIGPIRPDQDYIPEEPRVEYSIPAILINIFLFVLYITMLIKVKGKYDKLFLAMFLIINFLIVSFLTPIQSYGRWETFKIIDIERVLHQLQR